MTIRELPQQETRVETGPTRFGDDWPGVFIRGDAAFGFRLALESVLKSIEGIPEREAGHQISLFMLRKLSELLGSCNLNEIKENPAP